MKKSIKNRLAAFVVTGALAVGGLAMAAPAQAYTGTFNEVRVAGSYHWKYGIAQYVGNGQYVNDYIWSDMIDRKRTHRTGVGVDWIVNGYRSYGPWVGKDKWAKHHNAAAMHSNKAYREWQ